MKVISCKSSPIAKNYNIVNKREEVVKQFYKYQQRIDSKKELLKQLKEKKRSLHRWTKKKYEAQDKDKKKLGFPLIVVVNQTKKINIQFYENWFLMGYNGRLLSETDLL